MQCTEGCDFCVDASPCVAELNWPMRTSILVLACVVIGFLPPAAYFTFKYQQVKVGVVHSLECVFFLTCVYKRSYLHRCLQKKNYDTFLYI